jgi:hypothetical protein
MTLIPSTPPLRPLGGLGALQGATPGSREDVRTDRPGPEGPRPEAIRPETAGLRSPGQDALEVRGAADAAQVSAPRDVDPELWSLLTTEERSHFARSQALGPLTYGRAPSAERTQAPMRGLRLDLRV